MNSKLLKTSDVYKIQDMLLRCSKNLNITSSELEGLYNKIKDGLCENLCYKDVISLASESAATMMTKNPDFGSVAARIAIEGLHNTTLDTFYEKVKFCYENNRYFSYDFYDRVKSYKDQIQSQINYDRDFELSFFGFKTMEKSYLLEFNEKVVERPQDLFMRVALGIHYDSLEDAFETYHMISEKYFIHATPTMFSAGTMLSQFSSCFILGIEDDSIEGIFKAVSDAAKISKTAGGLGLNMHKLRASNSLIKSIYGGTILRCSSCCKNF